MRGTCLVWSQETDWYNPSNEIIYTEDKLTMNEVARNIEWVGIPCLF